ncbi:MAG: FAD-binding protein, partial [Gammaproteobacteria bacterium]
MPTRINTEILIVGTGVSGLLAAIELSKEFKVTIISKSSSNKCSTAWAQGGIAAVVDDNDHVNYHIKDTVKNGHELCNVNAVENIIKQGKQSINLLARHGVKFNKEGQMFNQTLEGGHSKRRIIYHNDNTGEEIHSSLMKIIKNSENITYKENFMAIDLIGKKDSMCEGLYAFDNNQKDVITIKSNITILASGGASKIYQYTTNPQTSTGDGIAMAWRFGCTVTNMEFIQFHPTCLFHPDEKNFLISESLRGEGAKLKDLHGNCFMKKYDDRAELAPRDVVARAIDSEMKNNNYDHVYLDISSKDKNFILSRFPTIYQRCQELGIDITKEPIPVVPA